MRFCWRAWRLLMFLPAARAGVQPIIVTTTAYVSARFNMSVLHSQARSVWLDRGSLPGVKSAPDVPGYQSNSDWLEVGAGSSCASPAPSLRLCVNTSYLSRSTAMRPLTAFTYAGVAY